MADVATNGVQDTEEELIMDDPLEDVQSVTTIQESTKNSMNTSSIIHELNGFEKPVNGGSYSEDLLTLTPQPREPEVLSPEQPESFNDQILSRDDTNDLQSRETEVLSPEQPESFNDQILSRDDTSDLDPFHSESDVKAEVADVASPGEGVLIDFDGGAANMPTEASEPTNNPFLLEDSVQEPVSSPDVESETAPSVPQGGDIMQTSFFGDASELASLNPFESDNNQANLETSPVVDTNPFLSETSTENSMVQSIIEQDIEVIPPAVEAESTNPFIESVPTGQNGLSPHNVSEESPSPNGYRDDNIENDHYNGETVGESGTSVDLPIVDSVPYDNITPEGEGGLITDVKDVISTEATPPPINDEVVSQESKPEEIITVSEEKCKNDEKKDIPKSVPQETPKAIVEPKSHTKESKPKSAPSRLQKKTPGLQKASSVPVKTSTPPRPPLTRSTNSTPQSTPRKPAEARQISSAQKTTAELRRSASSAATPTSRVRSSPIHKSAGTTPGSPAAGGGTTPRKSADLKKRGSTGSAETPSPRPGGKGPIKSRVGSLDNANHSPSGGNVKIFSKKPEVKAASKIGSKDNMTHKPGGGNVKIESKRQSFDGTKSRIGSMDNARHVAGGGDKKIQSSKLEWKAQSRIGSLDNATHKAGGGEKKIESKKLDFKDKAQSKVGSKDYLSHKAGGGDKKIYSEKTKWKAESKCGSLDNAQHKPKGGDKKIESQKLNFKSKAQSKVGSTDNASHKAGGGDKKIHSEKVNWKAESKVGSLDNAQHTPGGGDKKIETQQLTFRESAEAKTDSGSTEQA